MYGRSTLRQTGDIAEHAREVVKHREAQAHSIRLNVLEEPPSNTECMPCDDNHG